MNLLLLAAVFALILVLWMAKRSSDPYGEFHLGLNKLPGDDMPRTEWLNMGYWKVHIIPQFRVAVVNIRIGYQCLSASLRRYGDS